MIRRDSRAFVLAALRIARPDEWRLAVEQAIRSSGSLNRAAFMLGVTRRSLNRWIADTPALQKMVASLRDQPCTTVESPSDAPGMSTR
jgi:hypothetical protein